MIRHDLDVVPTVLPKYRLEEDARQAAKRMQEKREESNVQITRYPIIPRASACGSDIEGDHTSLRLFSVAPSPEIGTRVPHKLHVIQAPKRSWKRVRRTVYHGTLLAIDNSDDEETHRFSSLPMPEYESMACFLLTLPEEVDVDSDTENTNGGDEENKNKNNTKGKEREKPSSGSVGSAVAVVRELEDPLHVLRYERTDAPKEGQGISTSWYSGLNVRTVNFKRSYIDNDDEDGNNSGEAFSDQDDRKGQQKRTDRDSTRGPAKKGPKTESHAETSAPQEPQEPLTAMPSLLPAASMEKDPPKAVAATPDFANVPPGDICGLTAALLQQWASTGRAAAPFAEVARVVLKAHPEYTAMKERHQSPTGRQEAVEWFRVSQSAVRMHILQLGYMLDSSNNVHLSQQQKI